MTLLELHQYIAQHLDSYGEGFIGEDELPEDFTLIEDDEWTQQHKHQYLAQVFKDGEGNYFCINNSRSGSYHTDWYYGEPHIAQVKRVEKVVTKTVVSLGGCVKVADIKVEYVDHCGSDMSVVNAARVSFDKESEWDYEEVSDEDEHGFYTEDIRKLKPQDVKLINYLAKHKHKSPFNHAFITVRVKAPVFVARQLVKHKFMPWNEVSRRYVDNEPEFYVPSEWRLKAENVKQGSAEDVANKESLFAGDYDDIEEAWATSHFTQLPLNLYNWLLMNKVCAEQARMVLPQSVMTEWIWSGTLGAFADMLVLRLSPYTQVETRIVAGQINVIVKEHFPVSFTALLEHSA